MSEWPVACHTNASLRCVVLEWERLKAGASPSRDYPPSTHESCLHRSLARPYAPGRDILFVRPDAVFNKSKPISGSPPCTSRIQLLTPIACESAWFYFISTLERYQVSRN